MMLGKENYPLTDFRHKSGRVVIPTTWKHYRTMQSDDDYSELYNAVELPIMHRAMGDCNIERLRHKFWKGAAGHEVIGRVRDCGAMATGQYNGIRYFLRELYNHSCMRGDKAALIAANQADMWFHNNGAAFRYALPCGK